MFAWIKLIAWIKSLSREESDERFRAGFEDHQIAFDKSVNLSRSGDLYVDPAIQEAWKAWADFERAVVNAW